MKGISLYGLQSIPEVKQGDDLVGMIYAACVREKVDVSPGDIVVITSKIVSKAEGRILELRDVRPSRRAKAIAKVTGKNPVEVEIIIRESKSITAAIPVKKINDHFPHIFGDLSQDKSAVNELLDDEPVLLLTTSKQGLMTSDAGLDYSNNPLGKCTLLPADPSAAAASIRDGLSKCCGGDVAVIVTDTELTFTHLYGTTDIALGFSGIRPTSTLFGTKDRFGRAKFGGADVVVDELAGAAALLMGQTSEGIPVVVVKGLQYEKQNGETITIPLGRAETLSKSIRWSLLSTLKLRLAGLVKLFV